MEDEQSTTIKENLMEAMKLQQTAIKNNLQLQIANLIISMLIFIFLIVIVVLK